MCKSSKDDRTVARCGARAQEQRPQPGEVDVQARQAYLFAWGFKATVLFFINSTRIGCSSRRRRFIFSLRADQAGNNALLYGVVDSTQQRVGARYDAEAGVRLPALDLVNPTSHNGWRADTLGEGGEEAAGEAALPARAHGG